MGQNKEKVNQEALDDVMQHLGEQANFVRGMRLDLLRAFDGQEIPRKVDAISGGLIALANSLEHSMGRIDDMLADMR